MVRYVRVALMSFERDIIGFFFVQLVLVVLLRQDRRVVPPHLVKHCHHSSLVNTLQIIVFYCSSASWQGVACAR